MIKCHLSRLLGEKRMKISDVSRITGISRQALTDLYYERVKGIRFDTLELLCLGLNCQVEDILEVIDE